MGVRFARFIMGLVTIASDNGPPGRKIQSTLATPLERKNTRVRFSRKVELKVLVGVWDVTEQRVTEERRAIKVETDWGGDPHRLCSLVLHASYYCVT